MSNEPIDINDWLNSPAPLGQESTDFAEGAMAAVAGVTETDVAQAQTALDAGAQEAGGAEDLLATFPAALTAPVENGAASYEPEPLPEFEDLAQPAPEVTREEKLQAMDARDDALDARHQDAAARVLGFEDASHRREVEDASEWRGLRSDVRAVGDRVTLVFETINRLETDVAAFGKMFRALLKALEVEESELPEVPPAEPKRRRSTKKAE